MLLGFEFADLVLIDPDNGFALGAEEPLDQLFDLALDLRNLRQHVFALRAGGFEALVPEVAEDVIGEREQLRRRRERFEERFEFTLDDFTPDRLARALAPFVAAEIVGEMAVLAFGPVRRERLAAIGAEHEPAQREVLAQIRSRRDAGAAFEPVLNPLERLETDQSLMPGGAKRNVPLGHFDVARIERLGQQVLDPLVRDFALAVLRIEVLRFEEALHFSLRAEALGRETFEGFAHIGRDRLVRHHDFALRGSLIAIPDRRIVAPVTVEDAPAHPVLRLLAVLLALMLRDTGEQVFNELAIAAFAKFERGRFQNSARAIDGRAQLPMSQHAARKARNVVDEHDMRVLAMALEEGQHRLHAGAIDEAS